MNVGLDAVVVAEKEECVLVVTKKEMIDNKISMRSKGFILFTKDLTMSSTMYLGVMLKSGYWKEIEPRSLTKEEKDIIEKS